ncbi:MAG: hypothetical protein ACYDB2_09215 [Acidimicrobiales bacterium]
MTVSSQGPASTHEKVKDVPVTAASDSASVTAMQRSGSVVHYGRTVTLSLSVVLAATVSLPNGSYRLGRTLVSVDALSPPFSDYGSSELAIGVVVVLVIGGLWATRRRPKQSDFGTVVVYAGILGLILPDLWLRNTLTLSAGAASRTVGVQVAYGYWLNLSIVLAVVAVSAFVVWNERRQHP